MNTLLLGEDVVVKKRLIPPFITIALPFEPKITPREQLEKRLQLLTDKAVKGLSMIKDIPVYILNPAVIKLKAIVDALDYNSDKKSVIIFLSPFIEKVFYVNHFTDAKVIIGEPLNLKELLLEKREEKKYLVLSLQHNEAYTYLGEGDKLNVIVFNSSEHLKSHLNNGTENFLHHVDNVLSHVLKTYSLPLIVVGSESVLSLFQSISKNRKELSETIYSDDKKLSLNKVQQLIRPVLADWKKLRENFLLMKVEKALANGKAEIGIQKVLKATKDKRGKLLIVEKDFSYPVTCSDNNEINFSDTITVSGPLSITDAVGNSIERFLADGGNVEFVSNDTLVDHMHIALIT
ncbi:MAG: hypothetical protein JWQ40_4105 [Segetibacter sp.]|jgi:hypothetical protein|nr:hypothetical protein [Segetibacter sp.]